MQRRGLILTALAAPFVVRVPGLLMPVKPVVPVPAPFVQWTSGDGRWHDVEPGRLLIRPGGAALVWPNGEPLRFNVSRPKAGSA